MPTLRPLCADQDHGRNEDRMDPAHKAQDVVKKIHFYVQKLDAFALLMNNPMHY